MDAESDEISLKGDDYYGFLNIPRNATVVEISNAYRKLSRVYHPDKHVTQERKKEAEVLFNKTKKAYEALIDPHLRAIYDNLGTTGLEAQWELVQRSKTPQEIREEFEQLARNREDQRLQRQTNPKSCINISINATELFNPYLGDSPYPDIRDIFGIPHIEVSGMNITQSIESPLTSNDTAIMSGEVSMKNGVGSGNLNCSLRKTLSEKSWGEVEFGAGDGLQFAFRGSRSFTRRLFCSGSIITHLHPDSLSLESTASIANQLDEHTVGYLTWKAGMHSGMSTMLVRDTENIYLSAALHFGIPHTYVSINYTKKIPAKEAKLKLIALFGTFGAVLKYGAEKKVSQHSSLSATLSVGVPSGVILKLSLKRSSQTYNASIHLCEEIMPAPIIYGTVMPVLGWIALQKLIINPYLRKKKLADLQKQLQANKEKYAQQRQEALASIELMKETVKRIIDNEEAKKGLIIEQALYGHMVSENFNDDVQMDTNNIIDVSIQLQCLVQDSKLVLQESSKVHLPGFYDPCPGEDKYLRVRYLFHAVYHQVNIKDDEPLRIPKQTHRLES